MHEDLVEERLPQRGPLLLLSTTILVAVETLILAWAAFRDLGDASLGLLVALFALLTVLMAVTWGRRWARSGRFGFLGVALALILSVAVTLPVSAVAPGGIRYATFGFTVLGALPIPAFDFTISPSGVPWFRAKSHRVTRDEVVAVKASADDLVVGIGWNEAVQLDPDAAAVPGVVALPTGEAIARYQALRRAGRRVALLLHSTC